MKNPLGALAMLAVAAIAVLVLSGTASGAGAIQVSGLGTFPDPGQGYCTDEALLADADYLINLEGDLEGCVYGFVTRSKLAEKSGVSDDRSDEIFVGHWGEMEGTFEMVGNIHAKVDAFGFCLHPIVKGSGTGDFAGVTGRLDFRDDLAADNAPYTGHLKLG